jgi:hypothetical protein
MRLTVILIVSGAISLVIAWVGASRETILAREIPWLASGGFAGVGLLALGGVLYAVDRRRTMIAAEVDALARATREARGIADALQ